MSPTHILIILLMSFVYSHIALAESKIIEHANETANLIKEQSQVSDAWSSMVHNFLSEKTKIDKNFDFKKVRTPHNYYSLSQKDLKILQKNSPKIVHIEGYFSKKEYVNSNTHIKKSMLQLAKLKKEINADIIKKIVIDFHNNKTNVVPSALDLIIGLDYEKIEESLLQEVNHKTTRHMAIGIIKERTQTDYDLIRSIFNYIALKESDIFYDLGSGYGRPSIYGGILHPKIQFRGIEIVTKRAEHAQYIANELQLENVKFTPGDVLQTFFQDGTIFYMFNPFPPIMDDVMLKLKTIAKNRAIRIIAHGSPAILLKYVDWLEVEKDLNPGSPNRQLIVYKSKN